MLKKAFFLLIYILGALTIFHLGRNWRDLYLASKRISQEEARLAALIEENEELKKELRYLRSEEFVEEQTRDKLGLTREGETAVVIEEEVLERMAGRKGRANSTDREDLAVWRQWIELFAEGEE